MTFKIAVEKTPHISKCYMPGLKALGADSKKILLGDTRACDGSVFIDENVIEKYPNGNRWDYALSYKTEVFFVEVHTASTHEVSTMLRKLQWLKDWLNSHAGHLNKLRAKSKESIIWIQSDGQHFLPNSPQLRQAAQAGIKPIARLVLN